MNARALGAGIVGVLVVLLASGCDASKSADAPVVRKPAPDYAAVAARYNADIATLDNLWCRATTQLRYKDEDGDNRIEQGEGHMQVLRPDRVALSIGKVGQVLFWLGCDAERYWWMDLAGAEHVAHVGRHDGPARAAAARGQGQGGMVGSVSPRAVARVLGIVPLPAQGGTAEWSADGRQIVATTAIETDGRTGGGTRQRVWIDPGKNIAVRVQLIGPDGRPELSAELSEEQFVELKGKAGPLPGVAGKVFVRHPASDTEIRLFLDGLESGAGSAVRAKPAAFNFDALCKALRIDRVVDLDQRERARVGAAPPVPGSAPRSGGTGLTGPTKAPVPGAKP